MKKIFTKNLYSVQNEYKIEILENEVGVKTIFVERYFYQISDSEPSEKITIHYSVLKDLIKCLTECKNQIDLDQIPPPISKGYKEKTSVSPSPTHKKIQDRYLRGVSIKDLVIQFNMTSEKIEQILKMGGIVLISKKESQPYHYRKNYRKG